MRKHCPRLAVAASALCLALLPLLACAYNGTLVLEASTTFSPLAIPFSSTFFTHS
jgi:hypothetical protein